MSKQQKKSSQKIHYDNKTGGKCDPLVRLHQLQASKEVIKDFRIEIEQNKLYDVISQLF